MSENVARTVLVEDCFNLMAASDQINEVFKEAGRNHLNFAQFGSVTRFGDQFAVQLLDKYRDNQDALNKVKEEIGFRSAPLVPKTEAESVLAFVLGWLCHRAVDMRMRPESAESGLYQDAFIFNRLYVNNEQIPLPYRAAPFGENTAGMTVSSAISSEDIAELFRVMQQRFFIEMHTFVPDVEDIEGWFDRLDVMYRERTAYMDRYAEAVMNPDPDKVKQYVTGISFYNDEDAIIQLALSLRKGAKPSPEELEAAYAAEPKSRYGQALKQGFGNLLSASAYFSGSMDRDKLNDLMVV